MKIKSTEIRIVKGGCACSRSECAVCSIYASSGNENKLRLACRQALAGAEKTTQGCLVFLVAGRKTDKLALKAIAKIMAQEVLRHLRDSKSCLKEISFCVPDSYTYRLFLKHTLGYLDYIVNKLKSPFVTVDAIIELNDGIVLIKRSNPPYGWALPGGFVDYGESLERAVAREAKEETGLVLTGLKQFHTYSDPRRDPRFHTVGTVFIAQGKGRLKAGDDAAGAKIVKLNRIRELDFAFDHKEIVLDYIRGIF